MKPRSRDIDHLRSDDGRTKIHDSPLPLINRLGPYGRIGRVKTLRICKEEGILIQPKALGRAWTKKPGRWHGMFFVIVLT